MQESIPRARLRFDNDTKGRLRRLTTAALTKANKHLCDDSFGIDYWVDVFIGTLELYADSIPHSLSLYPPKQQKRRETIRSMGTALQRAIDIYIELDEGAKRYVFSEVAAELAKAGGVDNPYPNNYQTGEMIYQEEIPVLFDLQIIAKAIQGAAETIPNSDDEPIELIIARTIEQLFFDYGVLFTTSETGYAAECLRATLDLAGIEKDRVDYWLAKAKKHPDSMTAFVSRHRKSTEKIS